MPMIKQCKGKMLDKVAISCQPREEQEFFASIKYDGNYAQIHLLENGEVEFYTSGNKRFHLTNIADEFQYAFAHVAKPVALEAEYLYGCKGKLGDRIHSAKLTTYRTKYASFTEMKGTANDIFKVFNIIDTPWYFTDVVGVLRTVTNTQSIHIVKHDRMTFKQAQEWAKELANKGYEGVMVKAPDIAEREGKRVNTTIKLKHRPELIAKVIAEEEGEGRLLGSIGGLRCRLENGIEFSVGSGLDDYMRAQWGAFIDTMIEVEYEQLSVDGKPLQPVFKRVVGRE